MPEYTCVDRHFDGYAIGKYKMDEIVVHDFEILDVFVNEGAPSKF
jgi:hypothetical protein